MVVLYGDKQTDAIKNLIEITNERRKIQNKYNKANKIKPKTISKAIDNIKFVNNKKNENEVDLSEDFLEKLELGNSNSGINIKKLEKLMLKASDELKFEKAAELRDKIRSIENKSI
jgi:excinuclease ABC subunit B